MQSTRGPLHSALGGRTEQVGLALAAGSLPQSFQKTLMPRTNLDQGLVTGITSALDATVASGIQELLELVALGIAGPSARHDDHALLWRRTAIAVDLAAMGFGFALQGQFRQEPDEPMWRATARTSGWWLAVTGLSGATVGAAQEALESLDVRLGAGGRIRAIPGAVPAGLVFASLNELERRHRAGRDPQTGGVLPLQFTVSPGRALATGLAVHAGISLVSAGQRQLARGFARLGGKVVPTLPEQVWVLAGRALAFGLLWGSIDLVRRTAYAKLESGESVLEPDLVPPPTGLTSGGPGSLVPLATLGKRGSRTVGTVLVRDDIADVMGEPAKADPIRVYVSLDSAPTEEERVRLAVEELERTGAFDRSIIAAVSPTGTGYVNYVFTDALEYLARGDCAMVALQYAKRPSVLSLGRVWQGRRHMRLLLEGIRDRILARPPDNRPRLVVFGESLGAHTSQDAVLHQGTKGLVDLCVDRALWIGTPNRSGWKNEVLGPPRPDVDKRMVGVFDNVDQLRALPEGQRERIRYVMVSHDNDAVTLFGPQLLVQSPPWLGDPETRPPKVPRSETWTSPGSFVQTLVDMKNSANVIPGRFEAKGHDYRADLGAFVRDVFGLDATAAQMQRLEAALRRNELVRAAEFEKPVADAANAKAAAANGADDTGTDANGTGPNGSSPRNGHGWSHPLHGAHDRRQEHAEARAERATKAADAATSAEHTAQAGWRPSTAEPPDAGGGADDSA